MSNRGVRTRARELHHEPAAVTGEREKAGLTRRALAGRVGISEQLMGEIESGWRNATPANLTKIAEVLNCPRALLERTRPEPQAPAGDGPLNTTKEDSMQNAITRPWGIGRMRPYPTACFQPYVTVTVDPRTQTGVFRDGGGQVVEMGKHGTSRGTETSPQSTNMDSRNDTDHDQDSTQD